VARQNYYRAKRRSTTPTELRRQWLTGLIREVHVTSRGTYGYRRIHAELTMAMDVKVCSRTVSVLMTLADIRGLPATARSKNLRGVVTAGDLVNRKFRDCRACPDNGCVPNSVVVNSCLPQQDSVPE